MNRSYSKIRHIQEANQILESRRLNKLIVEQGTDTTNPGYATGEKGQYPTCLDAYIKTLPTNPKQGSIRETKFGTGKFVMFTANPVSEGLFLPHNESNIYATYYKLDAQKKGETPYPVKYYCKTPSQIAWGEPPTQQSTTTAQSTPTDGQSTTPQAGM